MRDVATKQRRVSLAGCKPRISPEIMQQIIWLFAVQAQVAKNLGSTSIRHRSDTITYDRYLIDVDLGGFAIYHFSVAVNLFQWTILCWWGNRRQFLPLCAIGTPLKQKCCHFDEIFITDCTGSCHFDNFQCSQWWKFCQNEDISVSVPNGCCPSMCLSVCMSVQIDNIATEKSTYVPVCYSLGWFLVPWSGSFIKKQPRSAYLNAFRSTGLKISSDGT